VLPVTFTVNPELDFAVIARVAGLSLVSCASTIGVEVNGLEEKVTAVVVVTEPEPLACAYGTLGN
jgi:hypothetical protein